MGKSKSRCFNRSQIWSLWFWGKIRPISLLHLTAFISLVHFESVYTSILIGMWDGLEKMGMRRGKACKPYPLGFHLSVSFCFSPTSVPLGLGAGRVTRNTAAWHATLARSFPHRSCDSVVSRILLSCPPRKSSVGMNAPCHLLCTKVRVEVLTF